MKRFLVSLSVAVLSLAMLAPQADAKRLGGGGTSGMKRDLPARRAPDTTPSPQTPAAPVAPQAVPGVGAGAAAAAAPKRSWLGPVAGLAAGLGIAALMSHFGMGAGFGNLLTLVLLALVAFVAIRFVMSRFRPQPSGLQLAGAGAGGNGSPNVVPFNREPTFEPAAHQTPAWGASSGVPVAAAAAASALPAGFDAAGFERTAKLIFIRMQAANDVADLNDLRAFTTPEMFATVRLELQERGTQAQQTDVVTLNAQVIDVATEPTQQVVSVRFNGLIREEKDAQAVPFDEVWHLVKPIDGSREWAIAGIAPYA